MRVVYTLVVELISWLLPVIGLFSPKIRIFNAQRKTTFADLKNWKRKTSNKPVLWLHCASLGEYEMVVPIISSPDIQAKFEIVVSFFSASGYKHAQTQDLVSCTFYLPLDRQRDMRKLVSEVNPTVFVLAKYDFWLNLMAALEGQGCNRILVNGLLREKQFITSAIAGSWRSCLKKFSKLYVQNEASYEILKQWSFTNVTLSKDLRYDRVVQLKSSSHQIKRIEAFVDGKPTLILGSSWPEEENIALQYLDATKSNIKVIVAPHDISGAHIANLQHQFRSYKPTLFSNNSDVSASQVLILDTIGQLSSAYQYATIAFIGGAFGKGLHNILEAAVYGLPIFTGPNIDRFPEAIELQQLAVLHTVGSDPREFIELGLNYEQNEDQISKVKESLSKWFEDQTGETKQIAAFILSVSV
ncbi:MAG: 3-deoxy-D-manno-octulosonic-acid transferase [Bacteroidia bacterium]|jgi:3-deoxy-D-manno-octulosonic-acid transferase